VTLQHLRLALNTAISMFDLKLLCAWYKNTTPL